MKFKAALFDLDGTLLDTLEDLADCMNSVLEQNGFPVHELERYKYFVGAGMENLVRRALPERVRNEDETVSACLESMREEYSRRWKDKSRPYEGVPELLSALSKQGLRLAILSNKPDDFTKKTVSKLLGEWKFEIVRGELPPVPRKPDPTSAIEIAQELAIPPEEFIYLGDSNIDMQTANGAGMYAVGALWGFRTADELLSSGARALIEKPLDLLKLL